MIAPVASLTKLTPLSPHSATARTNTVGAREAGCAPKKGVLRASRWSTTPALSSGRQLVLPGRDLGSVDRLAADLYTGVSRVPFAEDLRDELATRLEEFAAPEAARQLRERGSVRQEDKPVVREVLGRWRQTLGRAPFGETLWDLQTELGKGLSRTLHPAD